MAKVTANPVLGKVTSTIMLPNQPGHQIIGAPTALQGLAPAFGQAKLLGGTKPAIMGQKLGK